MKISDVRKGGHAPSLLAAFLHFDVSFMVWVVLGALMPFLTADPALTGENLRVTPTPAAGAAGPITLLVRGPKEGQPRNVYNLILKPGAPARATRASVKPLESFALDNAKPETLAALNV